MARSRLLVCAAVLLVSPAARLLCAAAPDTSRGDQLLAEYFQRETAQLRDACLADIRTIDDWQSRKTEYRRQLFEMLGLDPLPERTDLQATITGRLEHPEFTVEKLHFQSRPGLYVTGNLYLPRQRDGRLPGMLYVCGHGRVVKDGVSLGNKTHYQHHGAWFARQGYVCLVIDTLQLGEIEGVHHGTYRYDRWWWLSRGYTPAGVEAWNCIRALDYLQSRPEVDGERLGVTGRSGGGAYSWWISALDDRIRTAVPVAGITDLQNHVVDGAVEGHCDCMYMVNTYRWDYPQVAALNFPRPLLISNTDRDRIFPLDGVYRTYFHVRRLYELGQAGERVGLNITAGGHVDTQELQMHAIRWFDQHLRNEPRVIEKAAVKFFPPEELKVFAELPADQLNTVIDETFVPMAAVPPPPASQAAWQTQRDGWLQFLRERSFRGWPAEGQPLAVEVALSVEHDGLLLRAYDFQSQPAVPLRLYVLQRSGLARPELIVLQPLSQQDWTNWLASLPPRFAEALAAEQTTVAGNDERGAEDGQAARRADFAALPALLTKYPWAMAYVAPRGVGLTQWTADPRKQVQIRRRFYLLGQTWEGMQIWDIRRAMQVVRGLDGMQDVPLWLQAEGDLAVLSVYASLFEPPVKRLDLYQPPTSHRAGPAVLNVLRALDVPQAVALAAERSQVVLYGVDAADWRYVTDTAQALGWPQQQVQFRELPAKTP
jgi:dienelactone hydrolase